MRNSSSEEEASASSINSEVYGCAIERNWVSATFVAAKHELNISMATSAAAATALKQIAIDVSENPEGSHFAATWGDGEIPLVHLTVVLFIKVLKIMMVQNFNRIGVPHWYWLIMNLKYPKDLLVSPGNPPLSSAFIQTTLTFQHSHLFPSTFHREFQRPSPALPRHYSTQFSLDLFSGLFSSHSPGRYPTRWGTRGISPWRLNFLHFNAEFFKTKQIF